MNNKKVNIIDSKCLNCGGPVKIINPRYYKKELISEDLCQDCKNKLFWDKDSIKIVPARTKYYKKRNIQGFKYTYTAAYGDKLQMIDFHDIICDLLNNLHEDKDIGGYDDILIKLEVIHLPEDK